jgi:hypothetical protein
LRKLVRAKKVRGFWGFGLMRPFFRAPSHSPRLWIFPELTTSVLKEVSEW